MEQHLKKLLANRNPDDVADELYDELCRRREEIEILVRIRDELLSVALTPNLGGEKLLSYRAASEASGVPTTTLIRRWPNPEA